MSSENSRTLKTNVSVHIHFPLRQTFQLTVHLLQLVAREIPTNRSAQARRDEVSHDKMGL